MFVVAQFCLNSSVNKVIEKAPFDIIYRYKSEMRMNIVSIMESNFFLEEIPATRQEIELREKNKKILREL